MYAFLFLKKVQLLYCNEFYDLESAMKSFIFIGRFSNACLDFQICFIYQ